MPQAVIIGPPGSGKSTIGKALAKSLHIAFLDTDNVVEKNCGKKISDIFVDEGEGAFRDLEFEALTSCLQVKNAVLALGGGAPISERAQKLLKATDAPIIFLDVSLSVAAPRVGFNRDRPLLLGNPRAQWQALYDQRRPIYEDLATMTIKVDAMKFHEIVVAIREGALHEKR
ncbi:MAG: shikimate kinase [Candidatus Planktophila sp.]|nr:shikimate kinase [Candidatus Planktophila sp.]